MTIRRALLALALGISALVGGTSSAQAADFACLGIDPVVGLCLHNS